MATSQRGPKRMSVTPESAISGISNSSMKIHIVLTALRSPPRARTKMGKCVIGPWRQK